MPPKAVPAEGSPFSAADAHYIVSVLKHVNDMSIEWKSVAAEAGITRPDNAIRKFNDILKRINYKFIGGKIVPLEEAAATPKKAKSPDTTSDSNGDAKAKKTPAKKRTKKTAAAGEENGVEGGEDGPEAKKAKVEESE